MDTKIGRRHSLKVVGFGFLGAAGLVNLAACSKEESGAKKAPANQAPPADPAPAKPAPAEQAQAAGGEGCDATIEPASAQMRTALQYKEVSDQEGKNCANCAQFKPEEYGDACGGCLLFGGPVQNKGYCLSWAAKAEAADAAKPKPG